MVRDGKIPGLEKPRERAAKRGHVIIPFNMKAF